MAQYFSPVANDQIFDANGDPLVGGQIETYVAGSSTPAATYIDNTGGTPQSNPIILNSLGYPTLGPIWLTGGIAYKFIIKNAAGSTLRTIDNIVGIGDTSVSLSEWVESGLVPTYITGTSFSVPGDQTLILQIGRRLRTTNTSGLVYSTISNSVFAAGITTVTLTNDSTTLDAGLSLVAYALLAADPLSVPNLPMSKIVMATSRMLGRLTAGSGSAEELTAAQVTTNFVQAASETVAGKVELATLAEAQAWTADKFIDGAKLNVALKGANQTLAATGYQIFPGGLIVQWGTIDATVTTTVTTTNRTLLIPFPTACLGVIGSRTNNLSSSNSITYAEIFSIISASTVAVSHVTSSGSVSSTWRYLAWGY